LKLIPFRLRLARMVDPCHGMVRVEPAAPRQRTHRTRIWAGTGGGMPGLPKQGIGESQMIVTTMDGVAGRLTLETLGVVRGTSLWTRRVIKNSFGGIRNLEVTGIRELDVGLNDAKDKANAAMLEQASAMGADAIIGVRIDVVEMSSGVFCVNVTGTSVKTMPLPAAHPTYPSSPGADLEAEFNFAAMAGRPASEGSLLRH
jgi:uncharacterized protein YbjQ (UPF0145 family)